MVVNSVNTLQGLLLLILGVAVLAMTVFALVDALRHRSDAFTAAGKLTKPIWCGILGVAAIIAFIVVFNPLTIFGIICVVAAGVYLADVRPALRNITGGGASGPYGRW
jgi:drug/metabolite transporter (DMT)-like permease